MQFDSCMAEIRLTISRAAWRRLVADVSLWRSYKVRLSACVERYRVQGYGARINRAARRRIGELTREADGVSMTCEADGDGIGRSSA